MQGDTQLSKSENILYDTRGTLAEKAYKKSYRYIWRYFEVFDFLVVCLPVFVIALIFAGVYTTFSFSSAFFAIITAVLMISFCCVWLFLGWMHHIFHTCDVILTEQGIRFVYPKIEKFMFCVSSDKYTLHNIDWKDITKIRMTKSLDACIYSTHKPNDYQCISSLKIHDARLFIETIKRKVPKIDEEYSKELLDYAKCFGCKREFTVADAICPHCGKRRSMTQTAWIWNDEWRAWAKKKGVDVSHAKEERL